jgi:hypothetical protein
VELSPSEMGLPVLRRATAAFYAGDWRHESAVFGTEYSPRLSVFERPAQSMCFGEKAYKLDLLLDHR